MTLRYVIAYPVATVSPARLRAIAAGCSQSVEQSHASTAPTTPVQAGAPMQGKTAPKLGDLSAFHSIATDVAVLVDRGDLPVATLSQANGKAAMGALLKTFDALQGQ